MRSGSGAPGTVTSRCASWLTRSSSSRAWPPATKKSPVKKGFRVRPDPADGAGGKECSARHGRAERREEGLPARVVGMETGAPSTRRPLPEGHSGRQTRSQRRASTRGVRQAEYHDALRRGSTTNRRRVGDGRASLAAQAARGTPLQRSPHGAGWDHVGGAYRLLLAGDARRVRQMGECLPALRAVGKAGSLATHSRDSGRGGIARTSDQRTLSDAVGGVLRRLHEWTLDLLGKQGYEQPTAAN